MPSRLSEPDYQLVWSRELFTAEAAKLLNHRDLSDWNDRCELLLDDAFIRGYEGGPLSEFRDVPQLAPDDPSSKAPKISTMTLKQEFLRDLMANAHELSEDSSHRRPYWRERQAGQLKVVVLDLAATVRDFVALVSELDEAGYFEKRFGKDCVDDPRGDEAAQLIHHELGFDGLWPLNPSGLAVDRDLFLDVVEVLHDMAARPTTRSLHSYGDCGWHHRGFEIEPGRAIYRWRVNKILERGDLGLRLAHDGDDVGRLIAATDDDRTSLVTTALQRDDGAPADQVRHAIELFRARGADRNQKRSAVAVLALLLEERRRDVMPATLARADSGAIFDIANNFHIRHQDARQKRDYDDFYLDWIFWVYLSTVELTSRVIDEQRRTAQ